MFSKSLRAAALPLGVLGVIALSAPAMASADPCASSTPNSTSYVDSATDGGLLAPEITSGSIALDSSCSLALSYAIPDQPYGMLSGDFVSWFIDTDGNATTGAQGGFTGADYAVGRSDTGAALLRYDPASAHFVTVKSVPTAGDFGAVANLNDLSLGSGATVKVAGAASWTSSSTGNMYMDAAPDAGQPAIPFTVAFAGSVPAPAPAPAATKVVSVAPSSTSPASGVQTRCTVPSLKGLTVARARLRILDGNCSVGRIGYARSSKFAGRVLRTTLRAGTKLAPAAAVDITVGKKAKKHKKAKHHRRAHSARAAAQPTIASVVNALAG